MATIVCEYVVPPAIVDTRTLQSKPDNYHLIDNSEQKSQQKTFPSKSLEQKQYFLLVRWENLIFLISSSQPMHIHLPSDAPET